ncbi:MAG: hypothetical protein U0V72_11020 [Cytophagales bacterium]
MKATDNINFEQQKIELFNKIKDDLFSYFYFHLVPKIKRTSSYLFEEVLICCTDYLEFFKNLELTEFEEKGIVDLSEEKSDKLKYELARHLLLIYNKDENFKKHYLSIHDNSAKADYCIQMILLYKYANLNSQTYNDNKIKFSKLHYNFLSNDKHWENTFYAFNKDSTKILMKNSSYRWLKLSQKYLDNARRESTKLWNEDCKKFDIEGNELDDFETRYDNEITSFKVEFYLHIEDEYTEIGCLEYLIDKYEKVKHPKNRDFYEFLINKYNSLTTNQPSTNPNGESEKSINIFCKSMELEIPRNHFSKLKTRNDKGEPFLTNEQFIQRAFCGDTKIDKITFNKSTKEQGKIRYLFYEFYNNYSSDYFNTTQCTEFFIKLLTENFNGFDYKKVKDNFSKKPIHTI